PAIFHVEELTQPQGHSTSGSHERYKSPERLEWERSWDAMKKMKGGILENALANTEELDEIQNQAKEFVRQSKNSAWEKCMEPIRAQLKKSEALIRELIVAHPDKKASLEKTLQQLSSLREPNRRDVMHGLHQAILQTSG